MRPGNCSTSSASHALAWLIVFFLPGLSSCSSEAPAGPTPPLPVPTSFRGEVIDGDTFRPVAGASVTVTARGVTAQTISDEAGAFTATVLLPLTTRVSVTLVKEGYAPRNMTASVGGFVRAAMTPMREISGTVTEISGAPIAGVTVSSIGGTTSTTDAAGRFTHVSGLFLSFTKDGFVERSRLRPRDHSDIGVVRLQRQIVVAKGDSFSGVLVPEDLRYTFDEMSDCVPCQLISIVKATSTPHDITVHLEWSGDARMQIWSDDWRQAAPAPGTSSVSLTFKSGSSLAESNSILIGLWTSANDVAASLSVPVPFRLTVQ